MKAAGSNCDRNDRSSAGIARSHSFFHCWVSAAPLGAVPSQPASSQSSAQAQSLPQVTSSRSSLASPSLRLLVKSRPGDRAHSSGLAASDSMQRSSARATRSDILMVGLLSVGSGAPCGALFSTASKRPEPHFGYNLSTIPPTATFGQRTATSLAGQTLS